MMWLKANMCVNKMDFKSKGGTTYDKLAPNDVDGDGL